MVEWKTIGSLIERKRIKAKTLQEPSPVYAVTNTEGFVLSSSMHDFTIHSEDTSNYMVVSKNDFAYNPSRLNIGSISYFNKEGYGLISPMYVVFHADESIVTPEYLYTVIKSVSVRNKIDALKEVGARFRFDFSRWALIQIPIPSLEEQKRIVGILDTFMDSIENLKQQIAQRRKQYEHYRDQLLDLEGKEGVEWKKLNTVCEVINGRAYKQQELLATGKYRVLRVGNFFSNDSWYFSDLELDDKYYCNEGDLLYAWSASFGPHIWTEEKTIYHYHIWKMNCSEELDKKYMFYWLQSENMRKQAFSHLHGATMAHLTKALMESLNVPLLPLSEQQRIVSILDTFEASISNLEAQLAQRQKQYEYYRNQLLTFE